MLAFCLNLIRRPSPEVGRQDLQLEPPPYSSIPSSPPPRTELAQHFDNQAATGSADFSQPSSSTRVCHASNATSPRSLERERSYRPLCCCNDLSEALSAADARQEVRSYHNSRHSGLHQLSDALIDRIVGDMESFPLSIMALRMTCRRFHINIRLPFILGFNLWWRETFRRMLFRDNFNQQSAESDKYLCSACKYFHELQYFSEEELESPADVRTCRGSRRVFEFCSHLRLTFNEIKAAMANSIEHAGKELVACECDHQLALPSLLLQPSRNPARRSRQELDPPTYASNPKLQKEFPQIGIPTWMQGRARVPDFYFTSVRVVAFKHDVEPTYDNIALILENCTDAICPHIRVCDERVIATYMNFSSKPFWYLSHRHWTSHIHFENPRLPEFVCCPEAIGHCSVKDCKTSFVVRFGYRPQPLVSSRHCLEWVAYIETRRSLGALLDACDPAWLAQTVEE